MPPSLLPVVWLCTPSWWFCWQWLLSGPGISRLLASWRIESEACTDCKVEKKKKTIPKQSNHKIRCHAERNSWVSTQDPGYYLRLSLMGFKRRRSLVAQVTGLDYISLYLLTTRVLSQYVSDFNHMHTDLWIGISWKICFSPKGP